MPLDAFFNVIDLRDSVLLTARDDLDRVTAADAVDHALAVISDGPAAVIVDLAGGFIDTSGLRALEHIGTAARTAAVPLRIVGAPEWLHRMLPWLALRDVPLADDLPAAMEELRT
jgi:anti-anti-sigma regulatory factor